jgi:hypothetical protein
MLDNPYLQFTPGAGAEPPPPPPDNPYLQFKDTSGGEPARITVRPENRADAALNYLEAYRQIRQGAQGAMAGGVEQIGEGASGLVNPDADRSPRGPIPITSRLKAVGDILAGFGKTAGGAIEYTASPAMAGVRSLVSQPLENVTGLPREYTEFAAGMAVPIPKSVNLPGTGTRAVVPTVEQLGAESARLRQAPEVTGTVLKQEAGVRAADEIRGDLARGRVSEVTAKPIYDVIGQLEKPGALTVDRLDSIRQQLGDVSIPVKDATGRVTNAAEIRAAAIARDRLDQLLPNAKPEEVLFGNPTRAAETLAETRANESAKFSAETLNRKEFRAEIRAAAANSGKNLSNTMRQRIADILLDPSQRRGFSQSELAMMDRIVRGTKTENAVRYAGNFLGGGGGLGALVTTAEGIRALGPIGAIAALPGAALKSLSNVMTERNIERLNEMVRADSPLGRKIGAPAQDWSAASQSFQVSPTARNIARLNIASRNFSNNLRDVGINVAPDDLVRATLGADSQNAE